MGLPEGITWLKERTELTLLKDEILEAIANPLELRFIPAGQMLVAAEQFPDGFYILRSGEIASTSRGSPSQRYLVGTVFYLKELILEQPIQQEIVTLTDCEFAFLNRQSALALIEQYPEINQAFSQWLVETVEELAAQLSYEQERQLILRPYLVPKVRRGIVGNSRYAQRLRSQINQAADSRAPVLIFGEPGLEKDNIAALIHFSSPYRREVLIKVNCANLQASGAELFGRVGGKPGLIEAMGRGTLLFNNIQEAPPDLIPAIAHLLRTQTYERVDPLDSAPAVKQDCQARLIFISEKNEPQIDSLVEFQIKVPPLRVRKADIEDQVNYYANLICRTRGLHQTRITPEALRKLQSYDFPNNLRELENLVERAIVQSQSASPITEEVLWNPQSKKQLFRFNLLNAYPLLRNFLRSPWYPDRLNYGVTAGLFAVVLGFLWLGPQTRSQNFALNIFWAWWWPLILLTFPVLGRLWCSLCPFMIYGEITQKMAQTVFGRTLKKWPRQIAEQWGGWFLFALFVLILLWEELWDLPNTAYLSACLLLLITAGAMIFSAIFERRFWCRYLCPIGGMNGLFAKLSMIELRAQQGTCSAECTTYQCYKGGSQKGEGQETLGCPLYSHPAQLEDNRDCVLCMTCLKACPHRSVELNLRPPGIELWTTHSARNYEVALLFLLLNVVYLHHLLDIEALLGLDFSLAQFGFHFLYSVLILGLPVLVPLLGYGVYVVFATQNQAFKAKSFVELAYGYLPLVLAANLAHYLLMGLGEAGRILPVGLATLGLSGDGLPIWVAHPAVIAFLQGTTLLLGILASIILTQKIARQPFRLLLAQHCVIILLGIGFWQVMV